MTFRLFLVLWFCIQYPSATAQNTPIDSVEDSLRNELMSLSKLPTSIKRDSLIIKTLATLFMQLPSKEIQRREFYNDSLRRFAPKTKWNKAHAYQMYISGFMHTFKGENTLAFNDIEKALLEFRKHNDAENYENSVERLSILMARNMMLKPITDSTLSKKYLMYITERLEETKVKFGRSKLAGAYASLGQYYLMKRDFVKSAKYYTEEMRYAKLNTNKNLEFYEYNAGLFFAKGLCVLYQNPNSAGAKQVIEKVIKTCQTEKYNNYEKYLLLVVVHYLGNYYCEQNDFKNAQRIGLIGKNIPDFPQMPFYAYLVDNVLAKAFKGLHQPDEAIQYIEKVNEYQEKSGAQELSGNLAEWQLKYEDEKQKTLIKTLENEKLQKENERKDLLRNLLLMSLLVGIMLFIYVFWSNHKLRTKNEQLIEKNREIEEALFKGQAIERKRVAAELHDNLSAKISGIKWRLEAIEPQFHSQKQQQVYDSSVNALAEIYTDVRLIAHNLLPAELETRGLTVALANLKKELNQLDKTQFSLEIDKNISRFSNKIEYELFSIVLELSNNILKHSFAQNAQISLQKEQSMIKLTVQDDGVGFDEIPNKKGMGMSNLKSRVQALNGNVEIQSSNGVKVEIMIPFSLSSYV